MRKVLSFVLVLALVLGSFSFAFGLTDIEDSANKDAIQVCNDLGIIDGYPDGTFQGDKAVNRAEFAAMITRALGVPESALAGYATTSFKDVAGYGWAVPYLAFCESKGIMLGDGMGNAMPGRTISVNEAITMALRAVGYTENSALLVGSWPANYVTLGQQQGLYTDLATATTINRENAAQVIYNALTVDLVSVNADGETTAVDPAGAATTTNMIVAYLGATASAESVVLGAAGYSFEDCAFNITNRLGSFGTAYSDSDDVLAFSSDSTLLTGTYNAATDEFKVGSTTYDVDGVGTYATGVAIINGKVVSAKVAFGNARLDIYVASLAAVNTTTYDLATTSKVAVTMSVDLSGKYIKDIYSVVAWNAVDANRAGTNVQLDIEEAELLTGTFYTDSNDNIVDKSFSLFGVDSLEDIKKDDVVAIYDDGTYIRQVKVGTDVVEGTVEEVGSDFFVVDGVEYELSALPGAVNTLPDLNDEGLFRLDYDGDVYYMDVTGSTDAYGVVTAYTDSAGTWGDEIIAKVFTQDDVTKTYYFADDYEDVVVTSAGMHPVTNAGIATPGLIAYALNDDGELKTVDGSALYSSGASFKISTAKVALIGSTNYTIDSDAVVFVRDNSGATTKYDVKSVSDLKMNAEMKASGAAVDNSVQYILDGSTLVALLVDESALSSATSDDFFGVVNTATKVPSGSDQIIKLTGFSDGVAFTKYSTVTYGTDANFNKLATSLGSVNFYSFTPNASGDVTAVVNATSLTAANTQVTRGGFNADYTVVTDYAGAKYTIAGDAIVYLYDEATDKYSVASSVSRIGSGDKIYLYDVDGLIDAADADLVADVVIYIED